ncbi:MAG: hypothetical protein GC137_03015 [Alphaproteobacteria bacterium]|nr:hypothetical protein [Alphaproteobacteria bacterium]
MKKLLLAAGLALAMFTVPNIAQAHGPHYGNGKHYGHKNHAPKSFYKHSHKGFGHKHHGHKGYYHGKPHPHAKYRREYNKYYSNYKKGPHYKTPYYHKGKKHDDGISLFQIIIK